MKFFTSDCHFQHKNILRYCDRPWSDLESMNKALIDNWNRTVGKEDTVYVVGDFAFAGIAKIQEILASLNGTKILIRGNHDCRGNAKYLSVGFAEVHKCLIVEGYFCSHYPVYADISVLMNEDLKNRDDNDKNIVCFAYEKFYDALRASGCKKVLHGHIHDALIPLDKSYWQYNVGVDVNGFKPISLEQIKSLELVDTTNFTKKTFKEKA